MRQVFTLLCVLVLLAAAGCVEEYDPDAAVTPAQTQVTATVTAATPAPVQTPPPAEMAYISGIRCAVGDRSEAAYHCDGDVRVRGGAYEEVQVIARYKDNNIFRSGTLALGGSNPVSRPFSTFPDLKYKGQTPDYFVRLDRTVYPVTWRGDTGIAWSNLPADKQLAE